MRHQQVVTAHWMQATGVLHDASESAVAGAASGSISAYGARIILPSACCMSVPEIDISGFVTARGAAHTLVDVREPGEYTDVHVPGAILIPLGELPARVADIPVESDIYVICRSGARSARAVELLQAEGIQATNIAGGTLAWCAAGQPTANGEEPG